MEKILLIGNPNTGKTTLLNNLCNAEEHTGNWQGVTVEEKEKTFYIDNHEYTLVDLPGLYSFKSLTEEEDVSINYYKKNRDCLVLNTCDIFNLKKNLVLTLDLLSQTKNLILVINNFGKKTNDDLSQIEKTLKIKIVCLNFENKKEVNNLKKIIKNFKKNIKNDDFFNKNDSFLTNFQNISIEEKFKYISSIYKPREKKHYYGEEFLDKIFLNKFLAIPIFLFIMLGIFYLTFFSIGAFFSDFLHQIIQNDLGSLIKNFFETNCKIEWINGLISGAIISGVGSLISFLPQIAMLLLFLAILENTGYFSRIIFIFEDFFASIGLSGKCVYTLLMGFGCSASAVLSSRTLDSKNLKIKTALLTPYISCSAKLPLFAVLGGAFFESKNVLIIFSLYLFGIFCALLVGFLLDKFGLSNKENSNILEFPPYHFPNIKKVLKLTWFNVKFFLIKITTIFISMTIIIWILSNFSFTFSYTASTDEKSMLRIIGEFLAPLFTPLGFGNWGAVSALIGGIIAKEIIVSSIAVINHISPNTSFEEQQLKNSLTNENNVVHFTQSGALSFMTFSLLYCPCLATVSILNKEIGAKWTLVGIAIQLIVAYIASFIVFNIYSVAINLGFFSAFCLLLTIFGLITAILFVFTSIKEKNVCSNCKNCNGCKKI